MTAADWGAVVEQWERDVARNSRRRNDRRERSEEEEVIKLRQEVLGLISSGHVSTAMRLITSKGVADAFDQQVLEQVQAKFLPRKQDLQDSVPKTKIIDSLAFLRQTLLSLEPGTSPGSGGMRPKYHVALGERLEDSDIDLLEEFGLSYLNGALPPWLYRLWLSLQIIPLFKSDEKNDVCPLGVRNRLIQLFHKGAMKQVKPRSENISSRNNLVRVKVVRPN